MCKRNHHNPATRGFSLIEMVLSLSLVGLVLASLGSVLAFAMGAAPKADDPSSRLQDTQFPLSVMAEEIGAATRFTAIGSQKIVFDIADRTGDAVADTITYSWDGVPGSPLLRAINAETAVEVLDGVESLSFEGVTTDHTFTTLYPAAETGFTREVSPSTTFFPLSSVLMNSRMQDINLDQGFFQRLRSDTVPADAHYWVPDYAEVRMGQKATPGRVRLELRLLEAGNPTARTIAGRVIRTSDLGSEAWVRIVVPGTLRLNPTDELGLVVICLSGHETAEVRVYEQFLFTNEYAMKQSTDGGSTWNTGLTTRMSYRLVGSYAAQNKDQDDTETVVESVRISVTSGSTTQTSIVSEVDLPAPVRYEP